MTRLSHSRGREFDSRLEYFYIMQTVICYRRFNRLEFMESLFIVDIGNSSVVGVKELHIITSSPAAIVVFYKQLCFKQYLYSLQYSTTGTQYYNPALPH
jgi:hypothetical protein